MRHIPDALKSEQGEEEIPRGLPKNGNPVAFHTECLGSICSRVCHRATQKHSIYNEKTASFHEFWETELVLAVCCKSL